ncbi:MAG: aminopeptidase [Chloroflexi bacterium]|nr:aminopeptidase [Chloroflexota bacterium]
MTADLQSVLEQYAQLAVHVGLNLQPGQRLFIARAPLEAAPLVRAITTAAYQAGAKLVSTMWEDEEATRLRFQHAPHASFTEFPQWMADAWLQATKEGDAVLTIRGQDPDLLKGMDAELVGLVQKVRWQHLRPALDITANNGTNWLVIAAPVTSWARRVFPHLPDDQALAQLWDAVIHMCRLDQPQPTVAWETHLAQLVARREAMTARQFSSLHYRGPGIDLRIGLPSDHVWVGGASVTQRGFSFVPNLPTEEIFTLPHKDRVEGVVSASMPLSYGGTLIKNFKLEFSKGRVIDFSAQQGVEALRQLLASDEGAARLGEVALVPHDSPIAQTGILFFDGLIDENAACHLAFGSAYPLSLQEGAAMNAEAFMAAGGNKSLVHVDFMVGSQHLDIDGISADGSVQPIFRQGNWAFDVEGEGE